MHGPVAGVADLPAYQNFGREEARSKTPSVVQYETKADLLNFMRNHPLPALCPRPTSSRG